MKRFALECPRDGFRTTTTVKVVGPAAEAWPGLEAATVELAMHAVAEHEDRSLSTFTAVEVLAS